MQPALCKSTGSRLIESKQTGAGFNADGATNLQSMYSGLRCGWPTTHLSLPLCKNKKQAKAVLEHVLRSMARQSQTRKHQTTGKQTNKQESKQ
jgi:hypothetical protein